MQFLPILLFMLLEIPSRGDSDIAFRARLADAISQVTIDVQEQRQLARLARYESSYVERLAAPTCLCLPHECDAGRAKGSWQHLARTCPKTLVIDARVALSHVRTSVRLCSHLPKEERLAVYARGTCDSPEGKRLSRIRYSP